MTPAEEGGPLRLNKALSGAGLGSRRAVEELVRAGRVSIAGDPCYEALLVWTLGASGAA